MLFLNNLDSNDKGVEYITILSYWYAKSNALETHPTHFWERILGIIGVRKRERYHEENLQQLNIYLMLEQP